MSNYNWGTLYRLVMSQGRSEKNISKIKAEYELCNNDDERKAVVKKYQPSVKSMGQNKALSGEVDNKGGESLIVERKRTRESDGTYKGDDPSTPEKNEAFDPPKPISKATAKKTRKRRVSGRKG